VCIRPTFPLELEVEYSILCAEKQPFFRSAGFACALSMRGLSRHHHMITWVPTFVTLPPGLIKGHAPPILHSQLFLINSIRYK
jgi:hypothetical protein